MPFSYRRLPKDHIRLLEVISRAPDRVLCFRILQCDRLQAPKYTAVSYTWGNDEATETIWLDDERSQIRPNLWGCLYYLTRKADWNFVWADAICIDQNSIEEKNAQVRAMDRTYADAAAVSVWLGLATIPKSILYGMELPEIMTATDVNDFDFGENLQDVANRPYWTRFWVVQEFLLARQIHIWCSDQVMDDLDFKGVVGRETNLDLYGPEGYEQSSTSKLKALKLLTGRHPDRHPELKQSLYELLLHHRDFDCRDPRDRVFSLLSLMYADDQARFYGIFPDYNLSHDEVVVITLSYCIEHCRIELRGQPNYAHLFQALGVDDGSKKKRLLAFADRYHYSDAADGCRVSDLFGWNDLDMPFITSDSFLANEETPLIATNSFMGSEDYMFPFEYRGQRRARKSPWSLAIVLSVIVTAGWLYLKN